MLEKILDSFLVLAGKQTNNSSKPAGLSSLLFTAVATQNIIKISSSLRDAQTHSEQIFRVDRQRQCFLENTWKSNEVLIAPVLNVEW